MKNLKVIFLALIVLMGIVFMNFETNAQSQNSISVLGVDTISNSQREAFYLDLWTVGQFDSINVGIYAMGEIDLDSLRVEGGNYFNSLFYKKADTDVTGYENVTGGTVALTINNDAGVYTIVQSATVITANEVKGYNKLKFTLLSASSGNDATDSTQKYVLYYTVYKSPYILKF